MALDSENPSRLIREAIRLRSILTALVVFLCVVLIAERLSYAGLFQGTFQLGKMLPQMIYALPSALYLVSLWHFRSCANAVAVGQAFGSSVANALRRAGALLICGAITTFVMPMAYSAFHEDYARLIELDMATLIVAGIGMAMLFLGRLLDRARELQHELEEFF